jgi:opacity protein-like surface antigen
VVRLALATLAALVAAPVFSQDQPTTKWYVSADVGAAKMGVSDYAFGRSDAPRDRKSVAARVRAGYQFIRFFALEASYVNLGSYSTHVEMDCSSSTQVQCIPDFRSDVDMQALGLFGVGVLPVGERLTFRATVGFSAREKSTHQVPEGAPDYTRNSTRVIGSFGAGAGFAVTRRLDVYAEWNKYDGGSGHSFPTGEMKSPGSVLVEADVAVFSLGVRWRF